MIFRKPQVAKTRHPEEFTMRLPWEYSSTALQKTVLCYIIESMTAAEKQQLYGMLKVVADWTYGCPAPGFDGEIPDFMDDVAACPVSSDTTHGGESAVSGGVPQANNTATLDNIATKIRNCTRCNLCKTRTNTVPGVGVPHPSVLVIGEGPGADEDATGIPFVGRAGQLLDKMLASISLSRTANCFIANIVKCRPPGNRDPLPEESEACASYLAAQIATLKPAMILAVGRIAAQNLLNTTEGIGRLRGHFHDYNNIPLMATYHPSALLRNEDLKRPAWEDLKMFRDRLGLIVPGYDEPFKAGRQ